MMHARRKPVSAGFRASWICFTLRDVNVSKLAIFDRLPEVVAGCVHGRKLKRWPLSVRWLQNLAAASRVRDEFTIQALGHRL
ncbi:MAG: hypothetical protein DME94_06000 [Verrucomicrobia bacterium]|nr:MAG: hypothetical protein DME94_06000 [Verrucomicrobiota bacterium]